MKKPTTINPSGQELNSMKITVVRGKFTELIEFLILFRPYGTLKFCDLCFIYQYFVPTELSRQGQNTGRIEYFTKRILSPIGT